MPYLHSPVPGNLIALASHALPILLPHCLYYCNECGAMGVMRHPLFIKVPGNNYNPLHVERSMDEVMRAVRWQRLAPAFGAGQTTTVLSDAILKDTWAFKKGDSWAAWKNRHASGAGSGGARAAACRR